MPTLIDLSQPLTHGQCVYPDDPPVAVTAHCTVASSGCNVTELRLGTHQGTHIDAPFHYFDDGRTVDQIALDRFFGPASLIDLAPGSHLPANASISLDRLRPHADKFFSGAKVLYRTGWDRMLGTPDYFVAPPTLTVEAAAWIADRRIGLLGMDTPTPETGSASIHKTLLAQGVEIVVVEGLANLDKLPERFTFVGFPLNIQGRDGSPIRAVAVVD